MAELLPWRSRRRLVHGVWSAALLVAVSIAALPTTTFTPDEGIYGTQVVALSEGDWAYRPPSAAIDPDGEFFPVPQAEGEGGARPVYVRHPAYPVVLQAVEAAFGRGWVLLVPGLVGVLAAAFAAWSLADALAVDRGRLAFWLVVASPVAFNGFILWGHAIGAAVSGWAFVFLARAVRRPTTGAWLGVGALGAAGLLIRSEGLVVAGALVSVPAALGLARRRVAIVAGSGLVLLLTAGALLAERRWIASIVGTVGGLAEPRGGGNLGDVGFLEGRLEGLRRAIFGGSLYNPGVAVVAQLAALLLVAGAYDWHRGGGRQRGLALLGLGSGLLVLRVVVEPIDPITGLAIAWPVFWLGAAQLVGWVRGGSVERRLVTFVTGLVVAGIVATQYGDGGALQWGGRFFQPAVVPIAVAAAAMVGARPRLGLPTAALAALPAVLSVVSLVATRAQHERFYEAIRADGAELTISLSGVVPVAMWREPDRTWLRVEPDELDDALDVAYAAGVDEVTVVWVTGVPFDAEGWEVTSTQRYPYDALELPVMRLRALDAS